MTTTHASLPAVEPPELPIGLQSDPLRDAHYVARLIGVPRKTVLQYARDGRRPCVRIGRHVRFVIADVEAAIAALRIATFRQSGR